MKVSQESAKELHLKLTQQWEAEGKSPKAHPKEFQAAIVSGMMELIADVQKETLEKMNIERDKIQVAYERQVGRQLDLAMNLSRISPASSYTFAMTSLANTGLARQRAFLQRAKQYQREFARYLNIKLAEGKGLGLNPGDPNDKADLSDMPQFRPKAPTFNASLNESMIDILLLLIMGVVFFMATYVSFLRSDVL